jgi:o-succinylbenzoate synthase
MFACSPSSINDVEQALSRYDPALRNLLSMTLLYAHLFGGEKKTFSDRHLKLSALIEASDRNTAIALAQAYVAQGFSTLKIKIGGLSLDEEIKKVKTIGAIAGPKVKLRLDANQRFCFDDAVLLLKAFKRLSIDYIEDPIAELDRLKDLREECGIAIGLDEPLCAFDGDWDLVKQIGVSHVVIKPARFDTIFSVLRLIKWAKSSGITPIFSHAFESEFSSAVFAALIDHLDLSDHAHGVIADGMFKRGVFLKPLRSFRGSLSLDAALTQLKTDFLLSSWMTQVL